MHLRTAATGRPWGPRRGRIAVALLAAAVLIVAVGGLSMRLGPRWPRRLFFRGPAGVVIHHTATGARVEGHVVDAERIARGGSDFALRVTGESMRDAGILPGDIVLVRQDPEPRNGEIVVAMIGDETTVKRFERQRGEIRLVPENPEFAPLIVTASSPTLRILGRVVGVYREFA